MIGAPARDPGTGSPETPRGGLSRIGGLALSSLRDGVRLDPNSSIITRFAAAGLSGLLLALAFPPRAADFVAWVALIPLFMALDSEKSPGRAALIAAIFGVAFYGVDIRWIYGALLTHGHFSSAPAVVIFLAMVAFLSLFSAGFGFLVAFLRERGFSEPGAAPFLWVGLEYGRSILFTGFPWDLAGYSQAARISLVQIADITGVYGLSFIVVLVNATLWAVISGRERAWRSGLATVLALALVLGYGEYRIREIAPKITGRDGFRVAALQGNIPQELKWEKALLKQTFDTYEDLCSQAESRGAKLLVWPETAAPVTFGASDREWTLALDVSKKTEAPMLIGAPSINMVDGELRYYNSAFLADRGMLRYRYDKIHLVPFGEYMPLSWLLPLGPGLAAREADYSAGSTITVMKPRGGPSFSVLICYEAIFPDLSRLAVRDGATALINITNDGWFGHSAAPYQHLAMAGLRSVENRVWLIRAANTGVSAAFDPLGRIVKRIPLQERGLFTVDVGAPPVGETFYTRYGDVFAWACLGILAIALVSSARGGSTKNKRGDEG